MNETKEEEEEIEPEVEEEEEEEEEGVERDSNGISLKDKIKPEVLSLVNRFGNQFFLGGIAKAKCTNKFSKTTESGESEIYKSNEDNMYVKEVNVNAALLAYSNNLEKHGLLLEYDKYGMYDPNANTDHPPINNMSIFASTKDSSLGVIITYDPDQKKALNNSKDWLQIPFVVLSNEQIIDTNGSVQINGLRPASSSPCKCFITCRCQPVSGSGDILDNNLSTQPSTKDLVTKLLKLDTYGEIIESMNDDSTYQLLIDNKEKDLKQNILNFFIDYINSVAAFLLDESNKTVNIKKTKTRNEYLATTKTNNLTSIVNSSNSNNNSGTKHPTIKDIFIQTRKTQLTSMII